MWAKTYLYYNSQCLSVSLSVCLSGRCNFCPGCFLGLVLILFGKYSFEGRFISIVYLHTGWVSFFLQNFKVFHCLITIRKQFNRKNASRLAVISNYLYKWRRVIIKVISNYLCCVWPPIEIHSAVQVLLIIYYSRLCCVVFFI